MAETDLDKLSELLILVGQMIQELRHGRAKNIILVQELDKLTKGPTVHVPINVHTAMSNRIATLQNDVARLTELSRVVLSERDNALKVHKQPIDLGILINSLPPDVNSKTSLHDLKRICDNYNKLCTTPTNPTETQPEPIS